MLVVWGDDLRRALGGCLTSAKKLHEAVLPGWRVFEINDFHINGGWRVVLLPRDKPNLDLCLYGRSVEPSTAWVSAILRAKGEG